MTSIFLFVMILVSTPLETSPLENIWFTNFEEARVDAEKQQKEILVVFSGSDWCKPCIKLKREVFDSLAFTEYAQKHWTLVKVDFPRSRKNKVPAEVMAHRNALAEEYNPKGLFPLVLLLNESGEIKRQITYKGGGFASFIAEF